MGEKSTGPYGPSARQSVGPVDKNRQNSAVTPPESPTLRPLGPIANRSLLHGLLHFLRFGFRLGNRLGRGRSGQARLLPLLVAGVGRRRRGLLFSRFGGGGERR